MAYPETEILSNLVGRVFRIEDVTLGEPARGLIARYRGRLLSEDSVEAYDKLAESLRPYEVTPLFRIDQGQQVVYLVPRKPDPKPARASVNVILFILTVLSVLLAGASPPSPQSGSAGGELLDLIKSIFTGWPFAVSLLSILLAH